MLRSLTFLISAPLLLSGQEYLKDPVHFWRHESEYAGSEACKGCHSGIYERQTASHHALSLRPARDAQQFTEGLPVRQMDPISGSTLLIAVNAERRPQITASKGSEQSSLGLEWAFGSGVKGITPVGRQPGGEFLEGRLSWYSSLSGFDFTPGDTKYSPKTPGESLGRIRTVQEIGECFGCHTTAYNKENPAPAGKDIGIRCERCHGPGQEHIRSAGGKIFHPGRMPAFAQLQLCGACHGKPPQDSELAAIQQIESTPNTARFPSQRLVLSRCFNESAGRLKCTSCHDPHTNAARSGDYSDSKCTACHNASAQRGERMCPVGKNSCTSCHMSQERVMANSSFTDHWIRVVRSAKGER
jgi:hypothetical protein